MTSPKNEKMPSDRIMEIYSEKLKKPIPVNLPEAITVYMQKIYCDSIVQYLDEQHSKDTK